MQSLIKLQGTSTEGVRYICPQGVDYICPAGIDAVSIRLRCGTALHVSGVSVRALAAELRSFLGSLLLETGPGYLNAEAVDAILPNGSKQSVRLRGGSSVLLEADGVAAFDALLAKALGAQARVAA